MWDGEVNETWKAAKWGKKIKEQRKGESLLLCLQWLLTKMLPRIPATWTGAVCHNYHSAPHFTFVPFGPQTPPTENLPSKCSTFYVAWVTSWFCLSLLQTASEISKMWITFYFFGRIATASYVQSNCLGGKGWTAWVTQARPDQE